MDQGNRKLATPLLAAAFISALAAPLHAVTFAEPGDAGETPYTAQATGTNNTTPLTAITGTFSNASDADLYIFTITSSSAFSATTVNAASASQDTALFLFNSAGVAIATNDDASGTSLDSTLPVGNSLYATLAAGTYYLGISESGNEAVNSADQLLFNGYPGGDTTAVRGAAGGVNPTILGTFNNGEFDTSSFGPYEIDLTGAATAVPEPRTWSTLALGAAACAFAFLRRSRQPAV